MFNKLTDFAIAGNIIAAALQPNPLFAAISAAMALGLAWAFAEDL